MSNIIQFDDLQNKRLRELVEKFIDQIGNVIENTVHETNSVASQFELTTNDLAGIVGTAIGHYFTTNILSDKLQDDDFEKLVQHCYNLQEDICKGYKTHIDEYVKVIREAKDQNLL